MLFKDFDAGIRRYMLLADPGILKLIVSILVANRMPIIPPWIMIVGASSGGKSMILNGIKDVPGTVSIDDMTTNTFLSGQKSTDKSTSLLDNLPENPLMCFSDFTTMISKNKEARAEIFGQMRRVWDGSMYKKTGGGVNKAWENKKTPGLIGGVTTEIYSVLPEMSSMGERMVLYHMTMPDRKKVAKFSIKRLNDRGEELEIRKLFKQFIEELQIPKEIPGFPEALEDELIDLADLATKARSSIARDQFDKSHAQTMVHDQEMPIRLLKTIMGVATGMAVINGGTDLPAEDRHTLYRLALDSIPMNRKKVLNCMTSYDNQKSQDIQVRLAMDKGLIDRTLEDLNSHGVVVKYKGMGDGFTWQLRPDYRALLSKFENIIMEAKDVPAEPVVTVVPAEEQLSWENLTEKSL